MSRKTNIWKSKLKSQKEKYANRFELKNDPWGLDLDFYTKSFEVCLPLYTSYFKTQLVGRKNLPEPPYIVVANHGGQIPLDAILVNMAFFIELENPVILRAMLERFVLKLPFLGETSQRLGQILGDPKNCKKVLDMGHPVLVFPEGVRGIAKPTSQHYQTQSFGQGFFKIAKDLDIPIVPLAITGTEEMYPWVTHSKTLAKWLNIPSFPITPFFPLLGPAGALPMPSQVEIRVLEAIDPKKVHEKFCTKNDITNQKRIDPAESIRKVIQTELNSHIQGHHKTKVFHTERSTLIDPVLTSEKPHFQKTGVVQNPAKKHKFAG